VEIRSGTWDERNRLLITLRQLTDEEWLRGAIVQADKRRREETVLSYAQRMALHEAGHCEQIEMVLGARARK